MPQSEKPQQTRRGGPQRHVRHWRCLLGVLSWVCVALTAAFSSAIAVVLTGAVVRPPLSRSGAWGSGALAVALWVAVFGALAMLAGGRGRGAILGSWFRIPPGWVAGASGALLFWAWLGWLGFSSRPGTHPGSPAVFGPSVGTPDGGWALLCGSLIACVAALVVWQAALARVLALFGNRLAASGWPGSQIGSAQGCRLPTAGPSGAEIDSWLSGNDGPLRAGQNSLFKTEPSPQRVIASLRPVSSLGRAGTLALIGGRGSGKSSILRLAEGAPGSKCGIELRFVYVSLWEYKTAQSAIRAMVRMVIDAVRDKVDTLPVSGAAEEFLRTIDGGGRFRWLLGALGLGLEIRDIFQAISTLLLFNGLRVIICVEDDDRLADSDQRPEFISLVTGSLDFIRQFPGLGYVLCIASDWDELRERAAEGVGDAALRPERHSTIFQFRSKKAPSMSGEGEVFEAALHDEVRSDRAANDGAARMQVSGFDTVRLCGEELVVPPLSHVQWEPIVTSVRNRMLEQEPAEGAKGYRFGISEEDRKASWDRFLDSLKSPTMLPPPHDPRFGMSFTPRTLRRGLRDAWRKWSVLKQQQQPWHQLIFDPDSVLVACLLRASRPDVWNRLIREGPLLTGGPWPTLLIAAKQGPGVVAVRGLQYWEPTPWLGLLPEIRNMLLKQAPDPSDWGKEVSSPKSQKFIRPGGLIGTHNMDKNPGTNWRSFLNA